MGGELKLALPLEAPFPEHIKELLSSVSPFREGLKRVTTKHDAFVSGALYFDEESRDLFIDRQEISAIAELN